MNASAPSTAVADAATRGVPAQRTSDAYTAYASVHQLGIALQRASQDEPLRTTA